MTREEAIKYAKSKKMMLESLIYNDDCKYGNYAMYSTELSFVNVVISALRPISREQVEKVWRGEWLHDGPKFNGGTDWYHCSRCGAKETGVYVKQNFCSYCGAPMTDEAVEMAMEKINEMEGTENGLD